MLRAAIAFFVIALIAYFLGANNVAGVSMELGHTLLWVFIVLAVISFIVSLVTGRRAGGVIGLVLASTLALGIAVPKAAHAAEAGDKVADKATDTKTDFKKGTRTAKRQVRKATGHDSLGKDASDKVGDVKDDAQGALEKAKHH